MILTRSASADQKRACQTHFIKHRSVEAEKAEQHYGRKASFCHGRWPRVLAGLNLIFHLPELPF